MIFLLVFHLSVSALIASGAYLWGGPQKAIAFAIGSALALANIGLLHFAWKRILQKKLVALSAGVIVIKYATLGFIIYRIASRNLFQLEWVCVGLGMVVLSALATAAYISWAESRVDDEITNSVKKLSKRKKLSNQ